MASNSIDWNYFTPGKIEKLQKFLQENPIDPAWDYECKCLDSQAPVEQLAARTCYGLLVELGELPDGVPKWEGCTCKYLGEERPK